MANTRMQSDNPAPISVDQAGDEFVAAGTVLGLAHQSVLAFAADVGDAKAGRLDRETARLTLRYGEAHPRTVATRAQRDVHRDYVAALATERERAAVTIPDAQDGMGLMYGRVLDADGTPVAGATVTATFAGALGPAGAAGAPDGRATSDKRGQYQLSVPLDAPATFSVRAAAADGRVSPTATLGLKPGARGLRDLRLSAQPEGEGAKPRMPDVVGETEAQARERLAALGAKDVQTRAADASQAAGRVVEQTPDAGTELAPDTKVVLGVVAVDVKPPADDVAVPSVVGLPLDKAKAVLDDAKLVLGNVTGTAKGAVVATQTPEAGARVARGSRVDVLVRRG